MNTRIAEAPAMLFATIVHAEHSGPRSTRITVECRRAETDPEPVAPAVSFDVDAFASDAELAHELRAHAERVAQSLTPAPEPPDAARWIGVTR